MIHEYNKLSIEDRMALDDNLWYETESNDNIWYTDDEMDEL